LKAGLIPLHRGWILSKDDKLRRKIIKELRTYFNLDIKNLNKEYKIIFEDYFKKENFIVTSNSYFDILNDADIAKIDPDYLYDVISKMNLGEAEAVFLSCTNLPALSILDKLEKKLNKVVLSSNQVLIWDTLQSVGKNNSIKGFGKLFLAN